MKRRRGIVAAVLFLVILAAAMSLPGGRTRETATPPVGPLPVVQAPPRSPAPAVTLRPWSGTDLPQREPAGSTHAPEAAPHGQTPLPAAGPARDEVGDELLRDIARRSGRPADPGISSVISRWRAGHGRSELLQHAAEHIADPLQRVMVDGWIRDRFDPPRGPAALGAGGAGVHVPAVQPIH